ncbi:taurine ABC transporter substrate-binding protein [Bordetella petrii]|uniref:taurine ABC transporter substrate-binding protein n=1 Tax=Bordetella petrii TaxID=94624 RepID=UPI001E620227|nr:taurine ABC transporter substrate-binding protein [Bordetella petrii]MCD0501740.1 taurine ABC transporter substrate-binding protein [Bordetella petrii]
MPLKSHLVRFCTLAGLVFSLLMACTAHAQTKLVVGYQLIVGPFLSAIADGSFDKALRQAGYEVDWRQFSSAGDISTALASGRVPVGVLGSTGITAAATRGVDMELFWILDDIGQSEALVARNGSGINNPQDLKGKRVATPFVSTSHFHLLVALNRLWGIDPRELRILNMQPPQIVAAWQRGDIDAAYVWPPALVELQASGKTIADSESIGKASVPTFDGLVVDKAWAQKNPEFMAAFTRVLAEAYAEYRAHGADWTPDSPQVQGMVKLIGGKPDDIVQALKLLGFPTAEEQISPQWLGSGKESGAAKALVANAQFLKEQKQIDSTLPDYIKHVNASYAQAVAQ